jgi:hypothetical protein
MNEFKMITRTCHYCNNEFEAESNKKKYCSRSCQNRAYLERRNELKNNRYRQFSKNSGANYQMDEVKKEQTSVLQNYYMENILLNMNLTHLKENMDDKIKTIETLKNQQNETVQKNSSLQNENYALTKKLEQMNLEFNSLKSELSQKKAIRYLGWILAALLLSPYLFTSAGRTLMKKLVSKDSFDELINSIKSFF